MAAAYRVAAPSIRIVPWAALASCWPLPQQLLPVSATGGGRRRCTLAMFSGKIIIIICGSETPAGVSEPLFHSWGRKEKRHLQRTLSVIAARCQLPQSKPDGFASSLWEGAFGIAVKFPVKTQSLRQRSEQTERVLSQNSPSGRQISCLGTFAHAKSGTRLSGVRGAGSGCRP